RELVRSSFPILASVVCGLWSGGEELTLLEVVVDADVPASLSRRRGLRGRSLPRTSLLFLSPALGRWLPGDNLGRIWPVLHPEVNVLRPRAVTLDLGGIRRPVAIIRRSKPKNSLGPHLSPLILPLGEMAHRDPPLLDEGLEA